MFFWNSLAFLMIHQMLEISPITISKWKPKLLEIRIQRINTKVFFYSQGYSGCTSISYFLWICLFFVVSLYLISVLYFFLFSFLNIKKQTFPFSWKIYYQRISETSTKSLWSTHILLIYASIIKSTKSQFIKCSLKMYMFTAIWIIG